MLRTINQGDWNIANYGYVEYKNIKLKTRGLSYGICYINTTNVFLSQNNGMRQEKRGEDNSIDTECM